MEEALSTSIEQANAAKLEVAALEKERESLQEELEILNKTYNRTASRLKETSAKRRKLEVREHSHRSEPDFTFETICYVEACASIS